MMTLDSMILDPIHAKDKPQLKWENTTNLHSMSAETFGMGIYRFKCEREDGQLGSGDYFAMHVGKRDDPDVINWSDWLTTPKGNSKTLITLASLAAFARVGCESTPANRLFIETASRYSKYIEENYGGFKFGGIDQLNDAFDSIVNNSLKDWDEVLS